MMGQEITNAIMLVFATSLGFNFVFWGTVSLIRLVTEKGPPCAPAGIDAIKVKEVAVIIAAHNEELPLPACLDALAKIVSMKQVYVASDGSSDRTVKLARARGCKVIDIQPNGGKARALERAIKQNKLCDRYKVVLIQDADSEIGRDYLKNALPLFNDPDVVVVAGHVLSRWASGSSMRWGLIFTAYRTRLYRVVQMVFQFGMSWKWTSVSYIAPGFASMYRTSVLRKIDISAPGLVIEDFNMTFEVQHKNLGRISYTPSAFCSCEDPMGLTDYRKQVARWNLGLWQTVWRHGIWPGKFWAALGPFLLETMLLCLLILSLPFMLLAHALMGTDTFALTPYWTVQPVSPTYLIAAFVGVDYAITVLVAIAERRPSMLVYGLTFPAIRLLDALLFLHAFGRSFFAISDGRWTSPARQSGNATPQRKSHTTHAPGNS
jgi:poly-beta-1,6-N-acetyl-D-glucosamine synthase